MNYAKLFTGFIFHSSLDINTVIKTLQKKFGSIDYESPVWEFNFTDYYYKEMGKPLKRKFVFFKKLIDPSHIADIKLFCIKIEKKFSENNNRKVNIDPGYLNLSQLVLSTHKPFFHRIYLTKGVYAEVTLYYKNKTFNPFEWTYPDYRTSLYIEFFNQARKIYKMQITPEKKS